MWEGRDRPTLVAWVYLPAPGEPMKAILMVGPSLWMMVWCRYSATQSASRLLASPEIVLGILGVSSEQREDPRPALGVGLAP